MNFFKFFKSKERKVNPDNIFFQDEKRSYNAGKFTNMNANWSRTSNTEDYDLQTALKPMQARSNDLEQNNAYMTKYVFLLTNNVVGNEGFKLKSTTKKTEGGNDSDIELNKEMQRLYNKWCKAKNCDIVYNQSFSEICKVVVSDLGIFGESLVRIVRDEPTDDDEFGFRLQTIDINRLTMQNFIAENGNMVKMGIEVNQYGRPLAYYISKVSNNANPFVESSYSSSNFERVLAKDIFHIFKKEKAEQTRGRPWSHSVMTTIKDLEDFDETSLNAGKIGASAGIYLQQTGVTSGPGIVDKKKAGGGVIAEMGVGEIRVLPEGLEFKTFDPTYPTDAYQAFTKRNLQKIAAGLGLSQIYLANDTENLNYSVSRTVLVEERDNYKNIQALLIEHFVAPTYEEFTKHIILKDLVIVKGRKIESFELDRVLDYKFIPRSWTWIDPLKEIQAVLLEFKSGMKPMSQILAEKGLDLGEVLEAYNSDMNEMKNVLGENYVFFEKVLFGELSKEMPSTIDEDANITSKNKPQE